MRTGRPLRLKTLVALLLPGVARRFPFSAALRPRGEVFFRTGTGKWGDRQMTVKASGRSALIVAAGLFVCFAGPLPAGAAGGDSAAASKSDSATSAKSIRHGARHWKRTAHRKYTRTAKSTESSKATDKVADAADNS